LLYKTYQYSHECRKGSLDAPLDFEIFSKKKVVFLVSSGKNQISPLLAPPGKIQEKFPSGHPLEKIFPTPMNTARFAVALVESLQRGRVVLL